MDIDFSECEPNQAWLSRLNNDPDFLKEALDSWRLWSHNLLQEIKLVYFTSKRSSVYETKGQLRAFEVPDAFNRLTNLLVVWCDTSELGISGDPLLHYRDTVELHSFAALSHQSSEELHSVFLECHRLLRRIRLVATLALVGQSPATIPTAAQIEEIREIIKNVGPRAPTKVIESKVSMRRDVLLEGLRMLYCNHEYEGFSKKPQEPKTLISEIAEVPDSSGN